MDTRSFVGKSLPYLPTVFEWGDVSSIYLPLFFYEDKSDPHSRNSGLFEIDIVDDNDIPETCKGVC